LALSPPCNPTTTTKETPNGYTRLSQHQKTSKPRKHNIPATRKLPLGHRYRIPKRSTRHPGIKPHSRSSRTLDATSAILLLLAVHGQQNIQVGKRQILTLWSCSKNNVSIDFDAYQTWRIQHASSPYAHTNGNNATIEQSLPSNTEQGISTSLSNDSHEPGTATNSTQQSAPYPTSFSEIVALITEGRPIPGIKEVPDTVLDGQASQQNTSKRKKPWEENDARVGEEAGVMINVS